MEAPENPSSVPGAVPTDEVGVTTAALDVTTDDGPVRGVSTGGLNVFKGIPYAAPPTGNRRWAPP
ncbi:carboxylesterase, partial [Corallococcus llansteffanensis]